MSHPGATASDRHKVVIIGSGFGGLTAAKALKRADVDIKLIAKTTHHLFQPLLYQVATGIISEGEIAPPTRLILRKQKNAQVLLGDVTHIDLANKTVRSELLGHNYVTPYDTLIIAAGAGQSYFGNDHFAEFAPGMKSIDDALELRGRILGAFEQAERSSDPARREKLLTFVVVGAGPTGVEMAGQIAGAGRPDAQGRFRHIDPTEAHVILLDAAPAVLPPMGEKLGKKAQARLEKMGVEIQLNAMVTDVDRNGITVKDSDGTIRRIECGVQGVVGRRVGQPAGPGPRRPVRRRDRPGRPGEGAAGPVDSRPPERLRRRRHGRSSRACPAWRRARSRAPSTSRSIQIKAELRGRRPRPKPREPFKYFDKGSMATVSRFTAVAQIGKLEFGGFIAWLAWLVLHLVYLVGFKTQDRHAAVVDGDVPRPRPRTARRSPSSRPTPAPGSRNSRRSPRRVRRARRRRASRRSRSPCQVARQPPCGQFEHGAQRVGRDVGIAQFADARQRCAELVVGHRAGAQFDAMAQQRCSVDVGVQRAGPKALSFIGSADLNAFAQPDAAAIRSPTAGSTSTCRDRAGDDGRLRVEVEVAGHLEVPVRSATPRWSRAGQRHRRGGAAQPQPRARLRRSPAP